MIEHHCCQQHLAHLPQNNLPTYDQQCFSKSDIEGFFYLHNDFLMAMNDDPDAQRRIGNLYSLVCCRKDAALISYYWLQRASEGGCPGLARELEKQKNKALYELGFKRLEQGKNKKAFRLILRAAKRDYARAQKTVGDFYYTGTGVTQDYFEAAKWFALAKTRGIEEADTMLAQVHFDIADMYYRGKGVEQDLDKALEWMQKAMDLGNTSAKKMIQEINFLRSMEESARNENLAGLLAFANACKGRDGYPANYSKAIKCYEIAAIKFESGEAEYELSIMHATGIGVEKDVAKSREWLDKAVKHNHVDAKMLYDALFTDNLHQNRTPLSKTSLVEFQYCADMGCIVASAILAHIYELGLGVNKDFAKALQYYEHAAQGHVLSALYRLAQIYEEGTLVKRNLAIAYMLFVQASQNGSARAYKKIVQIQLLSKKSGA